MKKSLLIIAVLLFGINSFGQEKIKTSVFTLDLGEPSETSLKTTDSSKRLVFPSKNPLAFKLKNGNPYKYRYVINSRVVNFFEDTKVNYLDSIMKNISSKNHITTTKIKD
jgi:hypothetical protein